MTTPNPNLRHNMNQEELDKIPQETAVGIEDVAVDNYFETVDQQILIEQAQGALNEYAAMIREKVLIENRIDILAEEILGYTLEDHHGQILDSQQEPIDGKQMTLAFRGAGKSTVGTITRIIFEIIKNPNKRILLASNTQIQSEVFLREIKNHFAANDKLREIFGDFVGSKWDAREIIVRGRVKTHKESTVTCIGVGGPTASRHYDLIIGDDLADEENSRTELQRERLWTWYMKSLIPTLLAHGRLFILGTRWHPQDLYGQLLKLYAIQKLCIIPAIREDGTSAWPNEWPIDKLLKLKSEMGLVIFETQYQMNTAAMEGKIFSYDSFFWYENLPTELIKVGGVDLAISQKETADYFAMVILGIEVKTNRKYVIKFHRGRKKYTEQTAYISKEIIGGGLLKCGIEANAYQAAQVTEVADIVGKGKVLPVFTLKDKTTRAMKLAAKCENEEILFHKDHMLLIEELLSMPDGEHDDLFDALDIAVRTATEGLRKRRENEPGLL